MRRFSLLLLLSCALALPQLAAAQTAIGPGQETADLNDYIAKHEDDRGLGADVAAAMEKLGRLEEQQKHTAVATALWKKALRWFEKHHYEKNGSAEAHLAAKATRHLLEPQVAVAADLRVRTTPQATPEAAIAERTAEHVIRESARIILATALAHDPRIEGRAGRFGILGDRLIEDTIAGRPFSGLLEGRLALATPVVAIGAPVGAYYPEVARRLGAALAIPEHAAVCNAVGAVAGVVAQSVDILVNQPTFKVFRVHDPGGSRDYEDVDAALAHARRVAGDLALAAALRAGASDPHVQITSTEQRAQMGASEYLAEAVVRATATGRPLAGAARAL